MTKVTTRAWVLYASPSCPEPLYEEEFSFEDIEDDEVLVEPLYGCWEANMAHAIERSPVNIAARRREEAIVLGNSGVVRVLRVKNSRSHLKEGDVCLFCGIGQTDEFGYIKLVHAYDQPGSIGLLAKRTKVPCHTLIPIPADGRFSLQQWAAFSVRYTTAWSNWKAAFGSLRLQLGEDELPRPLVWGWGGGTTFAELDLARRFGCDATMISGSQQHIDRIKRSGMRALDRRKFPDLNYDPERFESDTQYRKLYVQSEQAFMKEVKDLTNDQGVSIFVEYIGTPVYRATMRALGRQGVITTAGWKHGMHLPVVRATECIKRHTHIFTHGARLSEVHEAMAYAIRNNWMPEPGPPYAWDQIPTLISDFARGVTQTYFPIYSVNPE